MKTFKILGLLLTYPSPELTSHMDELKAEVEGESLLDAKLQKRLLAFMDTLGSRNLMKSQEDYVALFDRGRAHSLHLFEHVHGESRDRGPAMVDLAEHYRTKGLQIEGGELPDYLPIFMEFLSRCSVGEAQETLRDAVHIVAIIGAKLKRRKSDYAVVFKAIESLSDTKIDQQVIDQALADDAQVDTSLEALDKEWEETPAFDGASALDCAGCPVATPPAPSAQRDSQTNL